MKKIILVFFVMVLLSPWFWVLLRNYKSGFEDIRFTSPSNLLEETNTLQSQSSKAGMGLAGKFLVNKFTFFSMSVVQRFLESFDPKFLFFTGDLDLKKSTREAGVLHLALLPLILYGFWVVRKSSKGKILLILLALSPLPSALIFAHYETISRIPLILVLTFLASIGLVKLLSTKKILAFLLIVLLISEFLSFRHDFSTHYPGRIERETVSGK